VKLVVAPQREEIVMRRCAWAIVLLALTGASSDADAPKPSSAKEPELRAELLRRVKADQDVRFKITDWMKQFGNAESPRAEALQAKLSPAQKAEYKSLADTALRIDKENTERLAAIVEQYGWPTVTLVGKDGANAAWLLVQHADENPKFQRKCLDLMTQAPREEVSQKDVAYLTDRVLLAEGKKQFYGTQFRLENGKCIARPLEDEANVDKRRATVGLPPLAEYFKQSEAFYGGGTKKK
jgi:hypothetical protein